MRGGIFVLIQLPFVDFRRLSVFSHEVVSRPSWPRPDRNEFIRRFGGISSRSFRSETDGNLSVYAPISDSERHFVDATYLLRKSHTKLNHLSLESCNTSVEFLRLIGDGKACVRFELAVVVNGPDRIWHNPKMVDLCVSAVLNTVEFQVRDGRLRYKPMKLDALAAFLRRRYFTATERHSGKGASSTFDGRLIRPLDKAICLVLPSRKTYRWLSDRMSNFLSEQIGFLVTIRQARMLPVAKSAPSYVVLGNFTRREAQNARRFRLRYLRIRAEAQVLWKVVQELSSGNLFRAASGGIESSHVEIVQYVERSLNRLKDTIHVGQRDGHVDPVLKLLWSEGIISYEFVDLIRSSCASLVGRNLAERAISAISPVFIGKLIIKEGDMSKYEIGKVIGSVGDHAVANINFDKFMDASLSLQQKDQITSEFNKLIDYIDSTYSSDPASSESTRALELARDAVTSDDKAGAMSFLKKAGEWTVAKASEIGVPVVIELLKKALGIA